MKSIRNYILGLVMLYKTSFQMNPVVTALASAMTVAFVWTLAIIFGI